MRRSDNLTFWSVVAFLTLTAVIMTVAAIRYIRLVDHSHEFAEAAQLEDQIKEEARIARFEKAAQAICGENAGWYPLNEYTIQCATHRGYKTFQAEVSL